MNFLGYVHVKRQEMHGGYWMSLMKGETYSKVKINNTKN